jgi:CHAD domain-containing protein
MKPAKLHRRWERRHFRLLKRVPELLRECHRSGGEEAIHQLRVALRRLGLLVAVGKPCLDRSAATRFRHWSRAVTGAVGPVRDLDVTLGWLAQQPGAGELRDRFHRQRRQLWRRARPWLKTPPKALFFGLRRMRDSVGARERLLARFEALNTRLARRLLAPAGIFFALSPARQHAFRRRLRRVRFLRELALPRRAQLRDSQLRLPIELHEALGELQNNAVATRLLRKVNSATARALRRALAKPQAERTRRITAALANLKPHLETLLKPEQGNLPGNRG